MPNEDIEKNYDLKSVNPNRKEAENERTPKELLGMIESYASKIDRAFKTLKEK